MKRFRFERSKNIKASYNLNTFHFFYVFRFKEIRFLIKRMEEEKNEFIIDDEKEMVEKEQPILEKKGENELTTYSYISKGTYIFFEYFVGFEIATLLGYKNPSRTISDIVSKSNQLIFRDYPGEKIPDLDPRTILITREGAIEILIKTRKRLSADTLHILKTFHIDTTNRKCLTKEQQTLSSIVNVFKTEKYEDQYKIGKYFLDLFFTEYKIVIECDENGHVDRKPWKERERMDYVNKTLEITDDNWIRFNPDEFDFDLSRVTGQIYRKIDELKNIKNNTNHIDDGEMRVKMEEEMRATMEEEMMVKIEEEMKTKMDEEMKNRIEDEKKKIEEEMMKRIEEIKEEYNIRINNLDINGVEEEKWELEIETTTGKFTPPLKEDLINRLKKYNVSEIAKKYGISPNPVSKWLKLYDIKVKDFHNYNAPSKEDLILQCKDKSQTEVGKHYGVSNHIIRKWLTSYELDFLKLKSEDKQIGKLELLKLTEEITDEEELAKKLNITVLNLRKLIKTHNLDSITPKEELEEHLKTKTKEEIAELYNTTRSTLRKWITSYELEMVRISVGRPIKVITEDNVVKQYPSMKELCKDLNIGHTKVYENIQSGEFYKGRKFQYVGGEEED